MVPRIGRSRWAVDITDWTLVRGPSARRYAVVATFRDGWWAVEVPELPGVLAHTSNRHGADALVREAIALELDASPSTFEVDVTFLVAPLAERRGRDRPLTKPLVRRRGRLQLVASDYLARARSRSSAAPACVR